jgi:hypothetical protein
MQQVDLTGAVCVDVTGAVCVDVTGRSNGSCVC